MTEFLDDLTGIGYFFGPSIMAFGLAAFSPLGRRRHPAKLLLIGLASGTVGAFFSILAMSRGTIGGRAVLMIIGISAVVGALISVLASGQTISAKHRDELVRKSDDQSWRV